MWSFSDHHSHVDDRSVHLGTRPPPLRRTRACRARAGTRPTERADRSGRRSTPRSGHPQRAPWPGTGQLPRADGARSGTAGAARARGGCRGGCRGSTSGRRSIAYATTPQLFTWCAKARDGAACARAARALGLDVTIYAGSRVTPAGITLRWDLIIVDGHGLGGVVPFLIDWHDSPHPAGTLHDGSGSSGLGLNVLELRHPDPSAVTDLLGALATAGGLAAALAPAVTVSQAPEPELVASLTGPLGAFELRGRGSRLVTAGA